MNDVAEFSSHSALAGHPGPARLRLVDLVRPREHGSWSLVFEPVALGLLVAPTGAGAALALATTAAFLARRPGRIAATSGTAARKRLAAGIAASLVVLAIASLVIAAVSGRPAGFMWIAAAAVAAAVFGWYDLRGHPRHSVAEVSGAAAFSLVAPAIAAFGGWSAPAAAALAVLMLARSVPTVLLVRGLVRLRKTGEHRFGAAISTALVATVGVVALNGAGLLPAITAALAVLLGLRASLLAGAPPIPARTIGIFEAVLGVVFVAAAAAGFHFQSAILFQ